MKHLGKNLCLSTKLEPYALNWAEMWGSLQLMHQMHADFHLGGVFS